VEYMAEVVTVPTAARTGRGLDAVLGYVADGFYDWDDFDVGGELWEGLPKPTFGAVQPGDIKFKNLNGDT
ncbi:hypothetical protein, partial [Alistipes onderdonkii]|uniref:hypothetical protein n=1 Tax=Alistipes onderdonkii TaxID=328813 RepID=UPI00210E31FA